MDIELLNFWIDKLGFYIDNGTLNILLHVPFFGKYVISLSNNKREILNFFGFNVDNIEYDSLSERDTFEYLSTSTKLCHNDIQLCSLVKGPSPKNKQHAKYNEYLKKKYYMNDQLFIPNKRIEWSKEAIAFFGKQKEYEIYISQCDIFTKIKKCFKTLNLTYVHIPAFHSFLMLYGIQNIIDYDDLHLNEKWNVFQNMNWSPLHMVTYTYLH